MIGMLIGNDKMPNNAPLLLDVKTNADGNEKVDEIHKEDKASNRRNWPIGNKLKLSNAE
jgi:hypothetical protein